MLATKCYKDLVDKHGQSCIEYNKNNMVRLFNLYPDDFKVTSGSLSALVRLCLHNMYDDLDKLYFDYISSIELTNFGNSEVDFVIKYGEYGRIAYKKSRVAYDLSVKHHRGRNSRKISAMSIDEQQEFFKQKSNKIWKTRKEALKTDPLIFKKQSPYSSLYEGRLSEDECKILFAATLGKGNSESGREQQRKSRAKRKLAGPITKPGRASAPAKKFLAPMAELLNSLGIMYNWGYDGKVEYWVRDMMSDTTYYFIDFACLELQLAIEFNGNAYHPRSPDCTQFSPPPFVKLKTAKDKFEYDAQKAKSIEHRGFTLFTVFENDNLIEKQQEIIQWIQHKYLNTTQKQISLLYSSDVIKKQ
jgi:very-short-patch-repair endonuclease